MLILSKILFSEIKNHAEKEYPHECCGGLIGQLDGETKTVLKVLPIINNWEDSKNETKTRRFKISSEDYKAIEKKASKDGLSLLGFYHSHPDHSPEPSETDLKFAWPFFSYPIISVMKGNSGQIKSYVLDLDTEKLTEEPIEYQIHS